MAIRGRLMTGLVIGLLAALPAARAEEPAPPGGDEATRSEQLQQPPAGTRRRVYGHDLMTREEAAQQRARMRAARTDEERARIRAEHHAEMQKRAAARGLELMPPGSGPGRGGMGPGGRRGMGPYGRPGSGPGAP